MRLRAVDGGVFQAMKKARFPCGETREPRLLGVRILGIWGKILHESGMDKILVVVFFLGFVASLVVFS